MITRRDEHLPVRWLVDLRDGVLSDARAAEATEHLASGCAVCGDRAAALGRTIDAIAAGPLAPPRRAELQDVLGLYARTHRVGGWPAGCAVAALVHDHRSEAAPALRGAAGSERRLLFTWDGFELDASVVSRARGADLRGQVLLADDDPDAVVTGRIQSFWDGQEGEVELAADGRFDVHEIPPGALQLGGVVMGRPFRLPPVLID